MMRIAVAAMLFIGVQAVHAETPGISLLGAKAEAQAKVPPKNARVGGRLPDSGAGPVGGPAESAQAINDRIYAYFREAVHLTDRVRGPNRGDGLDFEKARDRVPDLRSLILGEIRKHPHESIVGLTKNGDLGQIVRMIVFGIGGFAEVDGSLRGLVRELKNRGPMLLGMLSCAIGIAIAQECRVQDYRPAAVAITTPLVDSETAWMPAALEAPVLLPAERAFVASLQIPVQEWRLASATVRLERFRYGHRYETIVIQKIQQRTGGDWMATYPFPSR